MKKLFAVLLVLCYAGVALATPGDDLSKEIGTLIRTAEKHFFDGEIDQAATLLKQAEEGIGKLQAVDAGNKSLKTLQNKISRLKQQVDRKRGQSTAAAKPSPEAAKPAAAGGSELSSGAKGNLQKAAREMDFAEKELVKGEQSLAGGDFNLVSSYIYNAESKLDATQQLLDRVQRSNGAAPTHPEVAPVIERYEALAKQTAAFKRKAADQQGSADQAAQKATADAQALTASWLPRLEPFLTAGSAKRLQYPGSFDAAALAEQNKRFSEAQALLTEVDKAIAPAAMPDELKRAVDNLRFATEVYAKEQAADIGNRLQPIDSALAEWERRFEANKDWNETSGTSLFIITEEKAAYQQKQIDELAGAMPDQADAFSARLDQLLRQNTSWTEKRRSWESRPRPFPDAKMTSAELEKQMAALLADRGIEVIKLAIVDKDWWVQQGEFRYLATAILSRDGEGDYWMTVSFRQNQTLTGYGPTEIWDIDELKIRLP